MQNKLQSSHDGSSAVLSLSSLLTLLSLLSFPISDKLSTLNSDHNLHSLAISDMIEVLFPSKESLNTLESSSISATVYIADVTIHIL